MADKNKEQVRVANPTSGEKKPEGYRVSDIEQLYEDAKPTSWNDLVKFISNKADSEWHITPGEAKSMKKDFQKLADSGKPFTKDPKQAYDMAKGTH